MQSLFALALLAMGSLSPMASAQEFNISQVDASTRENWCSSQNTQCPLLCEDLNQTTVKSECFPDNLFFVCQCSNGVTPNLTQYSLTIPYFECVQVQTTCVANCGSDNDCSNQCRTDHQCGATDPKRVNVTTSLSASASIASETSSASPSSTSSGSSSSNSGAGSLMYQAGSVYGTSLFAVGVALGAAFIGL